MADLLARVFHDLAGRTEGLMHVRMIIQPLIACFLAIRSGLKAETSRGFLKQIWTDLAKLLIGIVILDMIYQLIALHMIHPGEAIVVAGLLAIVPYLLVRTIVSVIRKPHKSNH